MNVSFKQIWNLLARHIAPQCKRFVLLTLLLLGSIGLQVVNPQIVRAFIDASSSQAVETLAAVALAFIGIALFQQVVGATYVGENVAWTATNALRAELAQHCLSLDMAFHDAHAPGEMIERIDGDMAQWWGYWLITLAAGGWWTIFSPIITTTLLVRVSGVALLEKTMETKPGYKEYTQTTSAFVPWFLCKRA